MLVEKSMYTKAVETVKQFANEMMLRETVRKAIGIVSKRRNKRALDEKKNTLDTKESNGQFEPLTVINTDYRR